MLKSQKVLVDLVTKIPVELVETSIQQFENIELSDLFFYLSFLATALPFIRESRWIQRKKNLTDMSLKRFNDELFKNELLPIQFLQSQYEIFVNLKRKDINKKIILSENAVLKLVKSRRPGEQKIFVHHCLQRMNALFHFEIELKKKKKAQGQYLGISFYRTFDRLDEIFNLDYQADYDMVDPIQNQERLYTGAGVGVQSEYSTILTALFNLNLKPGDRVIDLGSGYGRVGLVTGLMHKDIYFCGYEFVQHRVEIANLASQNMQIDTQVCFFTCDLSDRSFRIPDADVYYLYDPFSEATYQIVLDQLVAISHRQKITIVTKGNARAKLLNIGHREKWPLPREFDDGNLCLFGC